MAKGGYRGGMPMGGMNQMQMMKQAQKMQQDLLKMQQEMETKEYEATAGGGVVTAVANGKRELLRIVKNAEGQISFDRVGKAPGRGAYICRSEECLTKAVRQHQLERALETRIDEGVFAQLREEIHAD